MIVFFSLSVDNECVESQGRHLLRFVLNFCFIFLSRRKHTRLIHTHTHSWTNIHSMRKTDVFRVYVCTQDIEKRETKEQERKEEDQSEEKSRRTEKRYVCLV